MKINGIFLCIRARSLRRNVLLLSMPEIQKYSELDNLAENILFDKIPGIVYYFRCVYRGLSGCVSRFEESKFNPVFNSQKYCFTYIGIALVAKAFHRC